MFGLINKIIYSKEYEMAIEMMEAEHVEAHIIAKRFMHVNRRILDKVFSEMKETQNR